jgi:phage shock protein PspC (stress-responsive transcriptional regulator)
MNHKKLTRSVSNRVLAGICGGLGKYLDMDPIVFRVIFCVLGLSGAGIIAYFILMFVIPSENDVETAASSSAINEEWVEDVAKKVKEEVNFNAKKYGSTFSIIFGVILISIGFFFLFPWIHFRLFFPIALIACGLLLLFSFLKKS